MRNYLRHSGHGSNDKIVLVIFLFIIVAKSVMIAQWNSSLSVLPVARVQFPATAEYFKGFFSADRTLPIRPEPSWQKMAQSPLNDTTQPVDSEEEGRSPNTDRRWLIETVANYSKLKPNWIFSGDFQ